MRHDMHVDIVTFEPGAVIPFEETHVMEHGLYVLEGKAVYRLNRDWVEVEAGDFMWLRAFCPQAVYAGRAGAVPVSALQGREPPPPARALRSRTLSRDIPIQPLTAEAFAPYGEVIEARGLPDRVVNRGRCGRYHDLAELDFGGGRAAVSVFVSRCRILPLTLDTVERHPLGSQAFLPLSSDPFLVVAAPDSNGAPGRPEAFMTAPGQGVNYRRGVRGTGS